jgi:hypothetical protein
LYVWFDTTHAGDFVLTLGGYHPRYRVPPHYPRVPRLGFTWPVTSNLTISGGAYFALTPGAIMGGGELAVNYKSGDLHAWLTAYADLLIEFAPFSFDVGIGISIGVSYLLDLWLVRETIRVEVGATLRLWGPPTAGTVTVHLWFIKFTVAFGEGDPQDDKPAPWSEVVKQLPPAENAVRLVAIDGLASVRAKDEQGRELWVVGPGAFSFAVRTAIPITTLRLGEDESIPGKSVDLRPRHDKGKGLESVFTLTLVRNDGKEKPKLGDWYPGDKAQARGKLPAALWGPYNGRLTVDSPQWVEGQLTGVDLRLPDPTQGSSPGAIKAGTLAHDDRFPEGTLPLKPVIPQAYAGPVPEPTTTAGATAQTVEAAGFAEAVVTGDGGEDSGVVLSESTPDLSGKPVTWARGRLFEAMKYLNVSPGTNDRLAADDPLVAGDIKAKPAKKVSGKPTATGARLYVGGVNRSLTPIDVNSLTAFEPSTLKQITPSVIAITADGRRAGILQHLRVGGDKMWVYDIAANPPKPAQPVEKGEVQVTAKALAAATLSDGKRVAMVFQESTQLIVLNLDSLEPIWGGLSGDQPGGVAASSTKPIAYASTPHCDRVRVVDVSDKNPQLKDDWYCAGPRPTVLALDPKGRWLYALNDGHSTVSVIDLTKPNNTVTAFTLRTGTDPCALVASPNGTRLYVANRTTGTVSVFDVSGTAPQETAEPVWVGPEPIALAVSPDSARLFVARSGEKSIWVVDAVADQPTLLDVTIPLTDVPVAFAVTVPPANPEGSAA